jgi:prepilin-type N-terminal cleavage/methylation domain-containing protein
MRRSARHGLTLIELLAASAISLIILAGVYQTLQQSRVVLRTGRDFAEQSGVVHRVHLLLADCVMQRKLPERLELFDQPREPRDLTLKKSLQRWQADVERIEWQRKQRATQPTFVGLDLRAIFRSWGKGNLDWMWETTSRAAARCLADPR